MFDRQHSNSTYILCGYWHTGMNIWPSKVLQLGYDDRTVSIWVIGVASYAALPRRALLSSDNISSTHFGAAHNL